MAFSSKPGKREALSLLFGLAGGTSSGKTYSGMRLAKGMAGGKRFAVVDTENGRANFYADQFDFEHGNLFAPFRPDSYIKAIQYYDRLGYPVILVDSMSHEYAGEGGILEWHDELIEEFVKRSISSGDTRDRWKIEESHKMRAWIEPKMSHKAMMARLLQVKAHLILCFRAEPKTEMAKNDKGKTEIRAKQGLTGLDGWFPICEKNMPFEMTTYLLLGQENPGVPMPITLREPHKLFFIESVEKGRPVYRMLDEEIGVKMAEWARGKAAPTTPGLTVGETTDSGIEPQFQPKCDTCFGVMHFVPAGQKTTGEAFEAFWRCPKDKYAIRHSQAQAEAARLRTESL